MSAYGCFTTVRVEADGVRGWDEHLRRLVADSGVLFERPVTRAEVTAAARAALDGVGLPVLLRIAVTATDHALDRPGGSSLIVQATTRPAYGALPALSVVPMTHRRALTDIKHLATMPELVVRRRAQQAGFDDALFVADGRVTEGPTWSLVARIGDDLVSPSGGLPSVTVGLLSALLPITVRSLAAGELGAVDDAVALNAGWGVRAISSIDGRRLVGGSAAERLGAAYEGIAREPVDPLRGSAEDHPAGQEPGGTGAAS